MSMTPSMPQRPTAFVPADHLQTGKPDRCLAQGCGQAAATSYEDALGPRKFVASVPFLQPFVPSQFQTSISLYLQPNRK